jgi:FkbM family methyltransferase
MAVKKALFEKLIRPIGKLLSLPCRLNAEILVRAQPIQIVHTKYGNIVLNVNNPLLHYRAKSFFDKEPDTLAWIDSFKKEDIFYDIGANIGVYSLYAGIKGVESISFEPESQNYAELNKNIYANQLGAKIHTYCIACSNENKSDKLYLSQFGVGQALHNFAQETDYNGNSMISAYQQTALSYPLDQLIEKYGLPKPTHVKIDVDGIEEKVIEGAMKTLIQQSTRSVLIEINESRGTDKKIVEILLGLGFSLVSKHHAPIFDQGDYSSIYNYIFSRERLELSF